MDKRLETWCDQVLSEVRFSLDHNKIRAELEEHIEDRCIALEELNYPPELAAERTLAAMGDPVEVGKALDREHSPWLGWLWVASVVALLLLCIMLAVELQGWGGKLTGAWERVRETVSPTPYEELLLLLDEEYDFADAGFAWSAAGVGAGSAVDAGRWTVEVPKAVWWKQTEKITRVCMVMTITPEKLWYGAVLENPEELIVSVNGEEAVNLSARKHAMLGSSGFPHFGVGKLGTQPLTHGVYQLEVTVKSEVEPDCVEISWPYGDAPWTVLVEREVAP